MTQSVIQEEGYIYMAMMDLKKDIIKLQKQNKHMSEQIQLLSKSNKKTSLQTTQKYEEIVKITTNSHLEISIQNDLIKKQNQIHEQLTKSNEELIKAHQIQNKKLNLIFSEQKECIQKVLKANQVIVNEELTRICKQQQTKINCLIEEQQKQNIFIEGQKIKIQEAFEIVQNFKKRNETLEKKLLQQKIQIDQYIVLINEKNQALVVQKILNYSKQADLKFQNHFQQISQIQRKFNQNKNQSLNIIQEQIRRNQQSFRNYVRQVDNIKNQTESLKNNSYSIFLQQNDLFNSCKAELQNLKRIKHTVQEKLGNFQRQIDNFQRVIKQSNSKLTSYQTKLGEFDRRLKALQDKLNNNQKKTRQAQFKIQRVVDSTKNIESSVNELKKTRAMVDQLKNDSNLTNTKFDNLQKLTSYLQTKITNLQNQKDHHHSHSKGHH